MKLAKEEFNSKYFKSNFIDSIIKFLEFLELECTTVNHLTILFEFLAMETERRICNIT